MNPIERFGVAKRWCAAASFNGLVFVGGHTPRETRGQSLALQTAEVLRLLDQTLAEMGSGKEAILGAQIFLSDLSKAAEMNAVRDEWEVGSIERKISRQTTRRGTVSRWLGTGVAA